jgi:hypothetical protein
MNTVRTVSLMSCLVVAALLSGCAELPFGVGNKFAPSHRRGDAAPRHDQVALREGINLYNDGDFSGAIRRLSSSDIAAGQ